MSKKSDRQYQIRQLLTDKSRIKISELNKYFDVSDETLRKDLAELEDQKILIREHGYVHLLDYYGEFPVLFRNQEHNEEKKRIAKKAAEFIKDNQVIYLDAGSTCLNVLPYLHDKKNLTIVTNSILLAYKCTFFTNLKITLIGGKISNGGYRAYGKFAIKQIDQIHLSLALLGTVAYNTKDQAFTTVHNEIGLKRHIIQQCYDILILADDSKFNISSDEPFCYFKEINYLITNKLDPDKLSLIPDIDRCIQT